MNDSEVPAVGKQVIVACAFIHHNFDGVEKIFMPKRAATKKFMPSVFELPGGQLKILAKMPVNIKKSRKDMAAVFARVKNKLAPVLADGSQIHHVGSTAVLGLDGKIS